MENSRLFLNNSRLNYCDVLLLLVKSVKLMSKSPSDKLKKIFRLDLILIIIISILIYILLNILTA